jgi:cardiolipin synthase
MIVVISRDALLMLGAAVIHMVGGRIHPRPTMVGKAATFFQILTVLGGLLAAYFGMPDVPFGMPVLLLVTGVAAACTVVSGLQYIVQGMRYLHATDIAERESRDDSMLLR